MEKTIISLNSPHISLCIESAGKYLTRHIQIKELQKCLNECNKNEVAIIQSVNKDLDFENKSDIEAVTIAQITRHCYAFNHYGMNSWFKSLSPNHTELGRGLHANDSDIVSFVREFWQANQSVFYAASIFICDSVLRGLEHRHYKYARKY